MTEPGAQPPPDPGSDRTPAEPVRLEIDGVIDLHAFPPREIKAVVTEYLAACRERDLPWVRIIHGKGIGALRRTVHAVLARHPEVVAYWLDHTLFSGAGATVVQLRTGRPQTE
jgi:DNA-nicking Smr family endonuclease